VVQRFKLKETSLHETTFQKLELVLSLATLHLVGWVETTAGIVGFRCTQPNLHFAAVIANCETQQLFDFCRIEQGSEYREMRLGCQIKLR
jgi:hypothetical protein